MEQTIKRPVALAATGIFAVAAYWLRQRQIQSGGSFFTYFTVAVVVLLAVYALFLGRRKKHTAILSRSPLTALGLCAAALAVTGGSAAMALAPAREFDRGWRCLEFWRRSRGSSRPPAATGARSPTRPSISCR